MLTRRSTLLFLLIWTMLVLLAVAWLSKKEGPSITIVDGPSVGSAEKRVQGFFKSEIGFSHLCPWILFGPYIALIAMAFPLERGRLLVSIPINVVACLAFLFACRALGASAIAGGDRIVIVSHSISKTNGIGTNEVRFEKHIVNAAASVDMYVSEHPTNTHRFTETNLANIVSHLRSGPKLPMPAPRFGFWPGLVDFLAYGALLGLAHSVHFYRRFREREHRALALESSLTRSQLDALKAQLQPHFLFNSLNAVVTLVRRDPVAAESTLISLSELLRLALSYSERQEITLREELEFVNRYIAIQHTRFGDKLRFEQTVEADLLDALCPTLLLQPVVENAIRHGIEPSEHSGFVSVSARRVDNKLVLVVEDNGVGLSNSTDRKGTGIGLKNLRTRLETLYGANQKLELQTRESGGVIVNIEIPWHK